MIFICTSMYCEADTFIKKLKLKKNQNAHKFQIFENEDIVLIITGVGKIKSAIAITYLFSKYFPKKTDFLINIGVCGCLNKNTKIGDIFMCNKIVDFDSQRNFYPDILFKHPFEESSILTCSKVIKNTKDNIGFKLVDMESSGVFQAGSMFMFLHQMFFIKIVSDNLNLNNITSKFISNLILKRSDLILKWINDLKNNYINNNDIFTDKDKNIISRIENNLKFSTSMKCKFRQLCLYSKLQDKDFILKISKYNDIRCKCKNEGKGYFESIKKVLIS